MSFDPLPAPQRNPRHKPDRRSDAIVSAIKDMIYRGQLGPGAQLPSERELATQFGVGRPTVREAIQQLSGLGLIDVRRTQGTFVRALSPEAMRLLLRRLLEGERQDVLQILDVRMALEGWAAAEAARCADPGETGRILDIVSELEAAERRGASLSELDLSFHRAVVEATHNHVLLHLMDALSAMIASVKTFKRLLPPPASGASVVGVFRDIADNIARRDPEGARQAMMTHVEAVRQRLLQAGLAEPAAPAAAAREGARRAARR